MFRLNSTPKDHTNLPEEGKTAGLRAKFLQLLGLQSSEEEMFREAGSLQSLFDQMTYPTEGHDASLIRNALSSHSGMADLLKPFLDPTLEFDEAVGLLDELNAKYAPQEERYGRYCLASFSLPNGITLRIRLYPEMDNALVFGMHRGF